MLKPAMPVRVGTRPSKIGNGLVVQIRNTSDKYLTAMAELANPTTGERTVRAVHLNPGVPVEIGWLEGWRFVSGDSICLRHQSFRSLRYTVP